MFVPLYFHLRSQGLSVSPTEFLELLRALEMGLVGESLDRFYFVARGLLIKRVEDYDAWDVAFATFFGRGEGVDQARIEQITDDVLEWLRDPKALRDLTEPERALLDRMASLDELWEGLAERLRTQTERHDGGSHWIGTGGTSPYGHGGVHAGGMRVGGPGGGRMAVQIAGERRFRNLRSDLTLDVRQMGLALRRLRQLSRRGREDELDIDGTIAATARNGGELEIRWRAPRANHLKLLLLMDVGGSMTPYSRLCSQLFSAAHQATHFKRFEAYHFHNCVYEHLYKDMAHRERVPTLQVLDEVDASWTCIIVGDAAMAPSELASSWGAIDLSHRNPRSGQWWLEEIARRMPQSVWLNPDPRRYWDVTYTTRQIMLIFDMFALTLDGLDEAIASLRRKRAAGGH